VLAESDGLSHSEIDQACRDAIKHAILTDSNKVSAPLLREMIVERKSAHAGRQG
jgi:hypothetical protein